MILRAYFDESYQKAGDSRVLAVGGGLSTAEGWADFEERWRAVLASEGVQVFHMTDFENRRPPYDWPEERRIRFISGLLDALTLTGHKIMAAACAVVLNDYDALSAEEREKTGPPYDLCSEWVVRQIGYFLNLADAPGTVSFVFEKRDRQGRFAESFERARRAVAGERRLESLTLAPKESDLPLQSADLLAYEAAKSVVRDVGADRRPHRKSLQVIVQRLHVRGYLFDARTLRRLLSAGLARPLHQSDLGRATAP